MKAKWLNSWARVGTKWPVPASDYAVNVKHRESPKPHKNTLLINIKYKKCQRIKFLPGKSFMLKEKKRKKKGINNEEN